MKTYWSLSKFADSMRAAFGIKKQPYALTGKGWSDYEIECKNNSPIGYALIESLDVIQNIIFYIPTKCEDVYRYFKNWNRGTHVLRTNTKRGEWGDLCTKIPDALMYSIIDFVEIECFHMQKYCGVEVAHWMNDPGLGGIDWLNFQIKSWEDDGITDHPYHKIIAAYWFAKDEYFDFDAYDGVDFSDWKIGGNVPKNYDLIKLREKVFEDKVTLHCKNIVEYRDNLWT